MPFQTELDSSLITVGLDGIVAFLPGTSLLNAFGASQEFAQFDVDATSATIIANGDPMATVDGLGNTLTTGTYLGSAVAANASVSVGIPLLATVTLQVDPIAGHIMAGDDGSFQFISDQPLDDDHLLVTASITVAGIPVSVHGPISGITEQLATAVESLGPLVGGSAASAIRGTADLLQTTANSAIITLSHDTTGTLSLDDADVVPCFVTGTLIETPLGLVAVECLRPGDLVMTKDHGPQPIRWAGSVRLNPRVLALKPHLRPIRIKAGALGQNRPARDLVVSPQHRILVRSKLTMRMFDAPEILIAAKQLLDVDGVEIARDIAEVGYHHFLCDQHEVVYANGAETESMYIGKQALKAVGCAATREILTLFPELADPRTSWAAARLIPPGRKARKMVERHVKNRHLMVD